MYCYDHTSDTLFKGEKNHVESVQTYNCVSLFIMVNTTRTAHSTPSPDAGGVWGLTARNTCEFPHAGLLVSFSLLFARQTNFTAQAYCARAASNSSSISRQGTARPVSMERCAARPMSTALVRARARVKGSGSGSGSGWGWGWRWGWGWV